MKKIRKYVSARLAAEERASRRWSKRSAEEQRGFQAAFESGTSYFQIHLSRLWKEYEKSFPRDAHFGSRAEWKAIRGHARKLLANLEKVNAVCGFDLRPLRIIEQEADWESQPNYRLPKKTDRRRIFWVSALLPYLIYTTGRERWEWIATFLGTIEGEYPGKENVISAWKAAVRRMVARFPPKPPLKRIPGYPPIKFAPFDYADAYLERLGARGMSKQNRADYLAIIDKQLPFLSGM